MKKIFLVIANYKDKRQQFFEEKISPINERYCRKHGFEYLFIKNTPSIFRGNPTWWKFTLLQEMLNDGRLKDGDIFTHFDADMVIVKDEFSYQTSKSFSYSIDNGNTHCMGNYSLTINPWSRKLIENILSEELYRKKSQSDHWLNFREQAAWYTLTGIPAHSWVSFFDLPNYGWHLNKTEDTYYSLEELREHVEIRGPEWNNTLLAEEANDPVSKMLQQYNIVKSKKEDTIVRHFAGGQPWNPEYTNRTN